MLWNKRNDLKYIDIAHSVVNYAKALTLIWELPTPCLKNYVHQNVRKLHSTITFNCETVLLKLKKLVKSKKAHKQVSELLILLTITIVYFITTQNVPEIFTI